MATRENYSAEFRQALELFVRPPQSTLIRYICASIVENTDYALHNKLNIVRVVKDVLKVQGFNPDIAFDGTETSLLINEAAIRLRIKTRKQCRALF